MYLLLPPPPPPLVGISMFDDPSNGMPFIDTGVLSLVAVAEFPVQLSAITEVTGIAILELPSKLVAVPVILPVISIVLALANFSFT